MTESRQCVFNFKESHPRLRSIAWFAASFGTKTRLEAARRRQAYLRCDMPITIATTQHSGTVASAITGFSTVTDIGATIMKNNFAASNQVSKSVDNVMGKATIAKGISMY